MRSFSSSRASVMLAAVAMLVSSASVSAQAPEPEPVYADGDDTLVYADDVWCDLFTESGTLMPVETCTERIRALLGQRPTRLVPQSLVPEEPMPPQRTIRRKGQRSGDTRSFRLPAGSYRASVKTRNCARDLYTALRPRGDRPPGRSFGDGTFLYDMAADDYTIEVIGVPKGRKKCSWDIRLERLEE